MATSACSSSSPSHGKWLRLARLLIDEGANVLKQFLLISIHPETLGNTLKKNLPKLSQLKSKGFIFTDQWEKLFPASGNPSNVEKFDITLLHLLIREFSNLPAPAKGWHKLPDETDNSIQANITRIKCFRNELSHQSSTAISEIEFEEKWTQISSSLKEILEYIHLQKIQKINCLKNDPIDDTVGQECEYHIKEWRKLQQQESEFIYELSSSLPDQMKKGSVHGRFKEIAFVKDNVKSGTVAVVLITGGPGFGKTTVARETAHELGQSGQTVLFCSLQRKETFDEVATEMIHSCREIPGQLPKNLENWLKNWSARIKNRVTFVLDNADGILQSQHQGLFVDILDEMRTKSKQNVAFVITSRKRLQDKRLRWQEVNLSTLSPEDAKEVLISRVNEERKIERFSQLDTIVKLCGCVPLALSIVGSLLSVYPEEMLLKHLEKEPMAILESDSESFPQAIANSFDLLLKAEQDALVAVSVFPGSFDCNTAEAVLKEYVDPRYPPIKDLNSLYSRCLVEQASARPLRYRLHPLIRAFGKMIGETKTPEVLQNSKQLTCVHFLSRLEENARILYWKKDKCRESIVSFGEDRHNYECCLQSVTDHEISSCHLFLNNFAQTCMYLEKCFAPNAYIQFLELLLTFKSFESQTHPVLRVELLCLLGQEMRRTGKKENYRKYMEEARGLFSEHVDEFETRALSHVIYLHNRARFVSEKNKPNDLEPKELYDEALEICEKEISNHPEKALNLLFAGRNAKRRKANEEAKEKLKKAATMLTNLLGDHFMTALCLKELGDFYFITEKTGEGLEKALDYYKEAMEVMEKLGMRNQKESILTLKNYGICHRKKGNFEKAKMLLLETNLVCDSEIEGDHMWKVIVKTALAHSYHEIATREENEGADREELLSKIEEFMKEGLEMWYRLNDNKKSISPLNNRKQIEEVLNMHPGRFERGTYCPDEPL